MSVGESKTQDARRILAELDRKGQGVFTTADLRQAFDLGIIYLTEVAKG